jgi:hypothetical protein
MATHLSGLQPLHAVLVYFGVGGTMSLKSPVGIRMVQLGGVFRSPQSGTHLPDGGVLVSLPLASLALTHSVMPILLCCSDGRLSSVMGVICFG